MATPRQFQPANFLRAQGYKKKGDGYINPLTGRTITKASALKRASNALGWKDFDTYKKAFTGIPKFQTQSAYERFKGFAEAKRLPTGQGTKFYMLFRAAFQTKPPFKPRSKELRELLTYVGKFNKRTKHQPGESPRKHRR